MLIVEAKRVLKKSLNIGVTKNQFDLIIIIIIVIVIVIVVVVVVVIIIIVIVIIIIIITFIYLNLLKHCLTNPWYDFLTSRLYPISQCGPWETWNNW